MSWRNDKKSKSLVSRILSLPEASFLSYLKLPVSRLECLFFWVGFGRVLPRLGVGTVVGSRGRIMVGH